MPTLPRSLTRIWTSVSLCIGYRRDRNGKAHQQPHIWSPRHLRARIHADPGVEETFLIVRAAGPEPDGDVRIRLLPDRLTLSRDRGSNWDTVALTDHSVSIRIGSARITVGHDGSVSREDSTGVTYIEADGAVLRQTSFVEAMISGDGEEVVSRTATRIAAVRGEGVLCKPRGHKARGLVSTGSG